MSIITEKTVPSYDAGRVTARISSERITGVLRTRALQRADSDGSRAGDPARLREVAENKLLNKLGVEKFIQNYVIFIVYEDFT